jgi:hypothetical protein
VLRIFWCLSLTLIFCCAADAPSAQAQCILSNPSFEIGGSGGAVFGGWNQFGAVGSSTNATHGAVAARVSGLDLGGLVGSAFWQRFDSAPGESWSASVRGWHTSTNPLTGQSKAILNIEWRNASGDTISVESHTVADASTVVDEIQSFTVVSGPAPSGTVAAHFLLAVLQSPTDPSPDVYYDQAEFYNLGPPTMDDMQWSDFPGGRTMSFSGRTWRVKGPGFYGPGPNEFCDNSSCLWVDASDRLHLTIQYTGGAWRSTEVTLEEALGYGDYIFTTVGRLDNFHVNVVLGLFLWQYGPCWDPAYSWWGPYNEIDVEFSRWGNPSNHTGQFVAQPWDWPGNISPFTATFSDGEVTSHAFHWLHDRVEYRSWRGGPQDEAPGNMIHTFTYTGPHIPRPEQPRVHMNLWYFNSPPTTNQEVVIDEFTFVPDGTPSGISDDGVPSSGLLSRLSAARPNPFNPHTAISYRMMEGGSAEIVVYDVLGRHVRTLVKGVVPAGDQEVVWDGRDDSGNLVSSGVYFYQLRAGNVVETQRMVLLK